MVYMYECKRQTDKTRAHNIKFCILEHFPLKIAKRSAPFISISVCPLASSIETVQFSWYKNLTYLKVTPTLRFNFYFPTINNNKMADTHTFEAVATLVLLTLWPQNDSSRLRILYCVTVMFCCSATFLLTGRKQNFVWVEVSVNEWTAQCVCTRTRVTEIMYTTWRVWFVLLSHFRTVDHISCSNAQQLLASPKHKS
jgi:hypothetical protein